MFTDVVLRERCRIAWNEIIPAPQTVCACRAGEKEKYRNSYRVKRHVRGGKVIVMVVRQE